MSPESHGEKSEAQHYLDEMVRRRGFVLDFHKLLVGADLDFAKAANGLAEAAYLNQRRLDRATKELLFITSLVAGGSWGPVRSTTE